MKKFLYVLSYDVIKSIIAFQEISQNYTIYWRQKLTQVYFHSSIWETCKKICLVYDRHSVYLDKHVSLWLHQYSLAPICMDKVNAASGICKFLAQVPINTICYQQSNQHLISRINSTTKYIKSGIQYPSILFYSILIYSTLFCSILFCKSFYLR